MPSTVLIAAPEHLPALKERADLGDIVAFSDSEALRALDMITRQRPELVALERLFAATTRGAALINRIKADPTLSGCEIRIVARDEDPAGAPSPTPPPPAPASTAAVDLTPVTATPERSPVPVLGVELSAAQVEDLLVESAPAVPATVPLTATAAPQELDIVGTRRAQRIPIVDGIEILVDGNPAMLVDLSPMGAQVTSANILRPNQRLRVSLPDPAKPIRVTAGVAWASFEMPKGGPRYRAGLEFFDGDTTAITRFCETNKR